MTNVPKKGDLVINPKTSRPVKVGGRIWLNLVREGLAEGHYSDPKKIEPIGENPDEQIREINKKLPRGKQAVRGRGKYRGQITTRNTKLRTEDVSRFTAQSACKIIKENPELIDDGDEELERLILMEMSRKTPSKTAVRYGRRSTQPEKFVLVEEDPVSDGGGEESGGGESDSDDIDYFLD